MWINARLVFKSVRDLTLATKIDGMMENNIQMWFCIVVNSRYQ